MKKYLSLLLFIGLALSANAQLLWKISGKGVEKSSYIFGTYHLSPLSIKDSIATMPQAVNETSQIYGEIVMADMTAPDFLQSMGRQMILPNDTTLKSLFTPEEYKLVENTVKEYMAVDIAMLAKLKPSAIAMQLMLSLYIKHTPGYNPQEQLDSYFQQQAQQQGKKVGGLETAQSQIDILFNNQSLQRQATQLYCMVSDIDQAIEQTKEAIKSYQKQDLDEMLRLLYQFDGDSCDPLPGEMEALLDNRNIAWVGKIPAIMTEAPTLFVVGAGHLPGDNGVLNLLKKQGYTVEAMN